ncbi:MAG: cupredoxin domain-containing protein, partial [Gemmatimonadales bacterium]
MTRTLLSLLLLLPGAAGTARHPAASDGGPPITVRLAEWKVDLGSASVPAGTVTFQITNAGTIPHAFELEGRGIEKETPLVQPGATTTLTLALAPGRYEV